MRLLLLISAVLAGVLLFLLATASANVSLFGRQFPLLLGLNAALAVALAALVVWQLVTLVRKLRARVFGSRLTLRFLLLFALMALVPGALVYTVSVQFLARSIESWFDLDVEPRFDGARQELHRHRVHDETGHHGEHGEAGEEPQREARAEYARPQPPGEHHELDGDERGEQRSERGVQPEQQRIVPREERGVRACRGQQEKPHRRHRAADDDEPLHRGGRTMKRFQGDSRRRSRPVSAESWNGLGRSAVSRRMRTAAS